MKELKKKVSKNPNRREVWDFNKEILFGEIGGIIGAPFMGFVSSRFSSAPNIISFFTLLGAIVGTALFWLGLRIYNKKKRKQFSFKGIGIDISFYTPVAATIAFLVCYPTLFFVARFLLMQEVPAIISSALAQLTAFSIFSILINAYRILLIVFLNKKL